MVSSQIYPFSLDVESVPLGPCPSGLGRPGGGGGCEEGNLEAAQEVMAVEPARP